MSLRALGNRQAEGVSTFEAVTETMREWFDRFEGRPNRAGTRAAIARIQNIAARFSELDQQASGDILASDEVSLLR